MAPDFGNIPAAGGVLRSVSRSSSLRLWPGVAAVVLAVPLRFGLPYFNSEWTPAAFGAGLLGSFVVLLWWLFFSRAPWAERIGAIGLIAAVLALLPKVLHVSLAGGMMGLLPYFYALPVLTLALVIWAALGRGAGSPARWLTLGAAMAAVVGGLAVLRTDGIDGKASSAFAWRWSETAEERLLAASALEMPAPPKAPEVQLAPKEVRPAEWPGFRGPLRDSVIRGARVGVSWTTKPPVPLWRRAIGPAWSSFAVDGGRIFTMEQRGEYEAATCYDAASGAPVWMHKDATRFWESNAGPGPRSTPALHGEFVFTFGATGVLNALRAADGSLVWTRNPAKEHNVTVPEWGFSSSPLIAGDLVIVAASGHLAAYGLATGQLRWHNRTGHGSYSSPHLLTLAGSTQIVFTNGAGALGVRPEDGTLLWKHEWPGFASLQPALTPEGDLLFATGGGAGGLGTRRISIQRNGGDWLTAEKWTSNGLKPYFNDLVLHNGHAYGFDGGILACIGLEDGKRKWKGGRYGHGQMVLLREQNVLLVLSEEGELALVAATPDGFTELAKIPALEGKTWNHPAVAGNRLFVRNGQEMAAFRLP